MKKRILKVMSMVLVAATLMTGTVFNEVVTVKAATNVETGAGFELCENGDIYNMTPESLAYYKAQGYTFDENGNFIEDKATHISIECHEKLKRSQLKAGDILI